MNQQLQALSPRFQPSYGLRNPHVQTVFSSIGPRRVLASKRFRPFKDGTQSYELDGGNGVRLGGFYNQAMTNKSNQLAILIHGWEGSESSSYMLSMASSLLKNGIDVFRLNMRDHGETHHLNEGLFNSTLLEEVIFAIADIQSRFPHPNYYLVGFSLGGNFCLRVAADADGKGVSLNKVIAFCPVVHANESNDALLEQRNWLYGQYFVRKWKKSLYTKLKYFPSYQYQNDLDSLKTLDQMNRQLVPKYTGFDKLEDYFDAYAITGSRLTTTVCPCYLHFSQDDMIIPVSGVQKIADNPNLHITVTEHGGHCGFLMNWQFQSWQDVRTLALIKESH